MTIGKFDFPAGGFLTPDEVGDTGYMVTDGVTIKGCLSNSSHAIFCDYSLLSTIFTTPSYNGPDSDLVAVLATTDTWSLPTL